MYISHFLVYIICTQVIYIPIIYTYIHMYTHTPIPLYSTASLSKARRSCYTARRRSGRRSTSAIQTGLGAYIPHRRYV